MSEVPVVEVLHVGFRGRWRPLAVVAGLLLSAGLLSGCGPGVGTVQGTVTGADGQLLQGGQVEVHTAQGVRIGPVEPNGHYTVHSVPAGEAKVCVRPAMPPPRTDLGKPLEPGKTPEQIDAKMLQELEKLKRAVPEKYHRIESTPLELSVKGGSNQ